MIVETTYEDKEVNQEVNSLVGKPFGFIDSLKKGGVGSHKLTINDCSIHFFEFLTESTGTYYANIELRPKGILVMINMRFRNFSWVIPYFKLSIYKSNTFSIYSGNRFLKFALDRQYEQNKKFLLKLQEQKALFNKQFDFPY